MKVLNEPAFIATLVPRVARPSEMVSADLKQRRTSSSHTTDEELVTSFASLGLGLTESCCSGVNTPKSSSSRKINDSAALWLISVSVCAAARLEGLK